MMGKLDEKDYLILDILQEDCRTSLTKISQKVDLSIDSVRKRIKKMKITNFYPKIQVRPRSFGFNHIVDVKIKLNNHSRQEVEKLISYLTNNIYLAELFSISGDWDLSFVIISKDLNHLSEITAEIKNNYGGIISEWVESTTLKVFKFENYNITRLMEGKKDGN